MSKFLSVRILVTVMVMASFLVSLGGCGYNDLQTQDEAVTAAWSEVVNQYQRRADLVPNLVNVVKGLADHEKEVLVGVTEARAKVGSINVTKDTINNAQSLAQFQQAQGALSSALSRLMVVVEKYPTISATPAFQDLNSQLEGTENRITVARNRYIQAVQTYNGTVRKFPTNLTAKMFDMAVKPNFTVENEKEISKAPTVNFGAPAQNKQ